MVRNGRSLISASEVGDYAFCARAWRSGAEGHEPASLRAARQAGVEWHRDHGRGVERSRQFHTAALVFTALAIFLGLLLACYLVLR